MLFMKENDLKIKLKDLDNIFILIELNILDIERWYQKKKHSSKPKIQKNSTTKKHIQIKDLTNKKNAK